METFIIGGTFILGALLVLVAVLALFRNLGAKSDGSFEFMGVKLSGRSAPALFLLVGAAMIFSGFGWASAQKAVERKDRQLAEAAEAGKQAVTS